MDRPILLIVDDEEKNIKLLEAMLYSDDYQIHEAHSGEQALIAVADCCPDLILLDVMMPGINGFEVCRQLKQDEKTRMIPIVMVTALKDKEHRIEAMGAQADDFLSKPVDRTELLIRVKSLLRIKSYHDDLLDSYREIAEKNAKLHELEKIKEGLTHMIIHDLNNPLMAISGNLDLILLKQQILPEIQVKMLENCRESCQDLNDMIKGLLDIHKMEEGTLQPDEKLIDLGYLVGEVLKQFMVTSDAKQMPVVYKKSNDIPAIEIDSGLIKRVIANLLNNAIRHTPAGGKVEVAIDSFDHKSSLCIRVKDTGDGLERKYHQKIFDKFEQVGLKRSGIAVGASGLGLAFCKIAVEAHGGRIWVESEGAGKGAQFCFTLPILK
jgi:signal transduction histidine kinase